MKDNRKPYIIAYSQVDWFLQNLPKHYIEKLPQSLVDFIKNQSSSEYTFNIDSTKNIFNQNYSEKAKALIAVLKYNYWSTDSEKRKIKILLENNERIFVKQQESYGIDNLFKSASVSNAQLAIAVPESNSFIIRLKKLILRILGIKK